MKTVQIINKLVSRDLNISENEVERVNAFFWKEARRKLSSMESSSVAIKHIGTITISKRKIDQFCRTMIAKIRAARKSERLKESTKAILEDLYKDKLRKALFQRNELSVRYNEIYAKRAARVHKTITDNIPELRQDFGGDYQSGEAGSGDVAGGSTGGDSEETIDLFNVPV